jgi:hypothetical protein
MEPKLVVLMNRRESLKLYIYIYINAKKRQNDTLCENNITVKSFTSILEQLLLFLRG